MIDEGNPIAAADAGPLPWRALLELTALLAMVATRALGYGEHVDFHMEDELFYLNAGRELFQHGTLPNASYAPVSSFVYGIVDLLPLGAVHPTDAMYWLGVLAAPLSLWWALRPLLPSPLALVAAVWLGTANRLLQADCVGAMAIPHVYAANAALVFLAVGALARRWTVAAFVLLAIAALNRAELTPWLALFGLLFALVAWRGRPLRRIAIAAVALLPLLLMLTLPDHRDRSWLAFQQHYSQAAVTEDLLAELQRRGGQVPPERMASARIELQRAFDEPRARVVEDFPTANSTLAALRENPHCFLHHVWRNVAALPASLLAAQWTTLVAAAAERPALWALVLIAVAGWWRSWRRRAALSWPLPVWLLLLSSPSALAAPLAVAARGELTWPVFPLAAAFLAGGCAVWLAQLVRRAWASPVVAAVVLALAAVVPGPFAGPPEQPQNREALALLQAHPPAPGQRLLCAWRAYPRLLDRSDVVAVVPQQVAAASFGELMQKEPVDLVLRTPELAPQTARWTDFDSVLAGPGWLFVEQRGPATLFRRTSGR